MGFGVRTKDAPETNLDTNYLRSLKPGDTTVRFCEETDEWITFWEHYNSDNKSYPCTGDRKTCPGCNSEDEKEKKASRKFATTVKLIDMDLYIPLRVPASVQKKMVTRSERNKGTILNRDYIVMRTGKGLDTEYDVEADRAYSISENEMKENLFDIEAILQSMWNEVWGEAGDVQTSPKEVSQDEDEEITESDLRAMRISDLRALARKHKVDSEICELGTKAELIDAIIDIAS